MATKWTTAAAFVLAALGQTSAASATEDFLKACLSMDQYRDSARTADFCGNNDKIAVLTPSDQAQVYSKVGVAYHWLMRYDYSIPYLSAAIQLNPKDIEALSERGWSEFNAGLTEQANQDFESALKLNPSLGKAMMGLAFIAGQSGDRERQKKLYEKILAMDPDYLLGRSNYADFLTKGGQSAEAIKILEELLKSRPEKLKNTEIGFSEVERLSGVDYLGSVLMHYEAALVARGELKRALAVCERLVAEYPKYSVGYVMSARLNMRLSRFDQALADANTAFAIPMGYRDRLAVKAEALYHAKKFEDLVRFADENNSTMREDEFGAVTKFYQGYAFKALGKPGDAAKVFVQAFDQSWKVRSWIITKITNSQYYVGDNGDLLTDKVRNAIEACAVDPDC